MQKDEFHASSIMFDHNVIEKGQFQALKTKEFGRDCKVGKVSCYHKQEGRC